MEGYHPHTKEASDQTIRSSKPELFEFPSLHRRTTFPSIPSETPSHHSPILGSPRTSPSTPPVLPHPTYDPTPDDTDSDSGPNEASTSLGPSRLRATSEPPPDLDERHPRPPSDAEFCLHDSDIIPSGSRTKIGHGLTMPSPTTGLQEYSWEWGAFPTPSPMKATFGKGGRLEGGVSWKDRMNYFDDTLEGEMPDESVLLGGKLSAKCDDDTTFVLTVGNRVLTFELSLVTQPLSKAHRTGKGKGKEVLESDSLLAGYDEIATRFEDGKLTFSKFMQDEDIISNPTLAMKWVNGQFVAPQDNPSLFAGLESWRYNTLNAQAERSEVPEGEVANEMRHARSKSVPPTRELAAEAEGAEGETTLERNSGSLWVQWWSRNRRRGVEGSGRSMSGVGGRPVLRPAASAPPPAATVCLPILLSWCRWLT